MLNRCWLSVCYPGDRCIETSQSEMQALSHRVYVVTEVTEFNKKNGENMETTNLYQSPQSELDQSSTEGGFIDFKVWCFKGRLNRLRYFIYSASSGFIPYLLAGVIYLLFKAVVGEEIAAPIAGLSLIVFFIITLVFTISLLIRRLHDLDKSGWMGLLGIIPFINIIFFLYVLFARGDTGANRYGLPVQPSPSWHKFAVFVVLGLIILSQVAISMMMSSLGYGY